MCKMYLLMRNFHVILDRVLLSSATAGKRNRINVISIPWTLNTPWKYLRGRGKNNASWFPVALVTSWVWAFWLPPQCLLWAFHYNTATTWDSTRLLMKSRQGTYKPLCRGAPSHFDEYKIVMFFLTVSTLKLSNSKLHKHMLNWIGPDGTKSVGMVLKAKFHNRVMSNRSPCYSVILGSYRLWLMEGSKRVDDVKYFTVGCLHTSSKRPEMLNEAKENSS